MANNSRPPACAAFTIVCFLAAFALFQEGCFISQKHQSKWPTTSSSDLSEGPFMGIGFDLTAFYGTAALSFPNGSIVNIARVEASSKYRKAMKKLSLDSSTHPVPPYNNQEEYDIDRPRQHRRQARKALGLPASDEVDAISTLLKALQVAVEHHLGYNIIDNVVATPHLVALYEEDLADVSDYLGLKLQYLPYWHNHITETGAAYVGYGFGLCSNYTDPPGCNAEMKAMPSENVMAVLYTKQALTVTLSKMQSAWYMWEPRYRYREHLDLGHDALEEGSKEEYYWENVRQALMGIMVANPYYPLPDRVLLMGDCANERKFRVVLDDALGSLMGKFPSILAEDTVYVAAKGAAELAKRGPYYPWLQNQDTNREQGRSWGNIIVTEQNVEADHISTEPLWASRQKSRNSDL